MKIVRIVVDNIVCALGLGGEVRRKEVDEVKLDGTRGYVSFGFQIPV